MHRPFISCDKEDTYHVSFTFKLTGHPKPCEQDLQGPFWKCWAWNLKRYTVIHNKLESLHNFSCTCQEAGEGRACTKMGAALPSRGSPDSPRCWGWTSSARNISSEWNRRIFSVREVILVAEKRRSGAWLCTPFLLDSLVPMEVWIAIRIVRGMRLHPPLASTFLPWNLSQCQSCMMCVKKQSAYNYNIIQLFC